MRPIPAACLLFGVACSSPSQPKSSDKKEPVSRARVEGAVVAARVVKAADPADRTKPATAESSGQMQPATTEASDSRALVLAAGNLLRLAPSGSTEVVAKAGDAIECRFDESHNVVWLVSDTAIRAYDPHDGNVHEVASSIASKDGGIQWQVHSSAAPPPVPTVTASNVAGIDACVSLVVSVGPSPRVGGEIIAQGDREWYCFADDDDVGKERKDQTLSAEQAAVKARYDAAKLTGGAFLTSLATRFAKDGPVERPKLTAPAPPKPAVDKSACEENPGESTQRRRPNGLVLQDTGATQSQTAWQVSLAAVRSASGAG